MARSSLILLAALLALGLAAAWLSLGPATSGESAEPLPRALRAPTPTETLAGPPATRTLPSEAQVPLDDPRRFAGRGRIRGELVLDGVAPPPRWTLVLEPDPTLVGAERAERRRLAFEGSLEFEAGDLPLGGYRASAEAPALNSSRVSVLLVRGSSDVFVSLRLSPAGLVDGFVLTHAGAPAEDLAVTIENAASRARAETRVDAAGLFLFEGVVDGDYTIAFGDPEAPLLARGTFTFRAPTLRWRETHLPPAGAALLRVVDAAGLAVAGAEILGSSTPRGALRGRTEPDGVLVARHLLPGRYALSATAPDGRSGGGALVVEAGALAEATIVVD
ncbi:MAG: carboxypeptidase regulatory-like domain-containing protein [Planctomycetes bacterium]|nr:carboxypeptidase regulatory-like domain-containing protein [Planctomycetota bacterium]